MVRMVGLKGKLPVDGELAEGSDEEDEKQNGPTQNFKQSGELVTHSWRHS